MRPDTDRGERELDAAAFGEPQQRGHQVGRERLGNDHLVAAALHGHLHPVESRDVLARFCDLFLEGLDRQANHRVGGGE
jgi:hypothetical protein